MNRPTDYIATWFYRETAEEASFYPQIGKRGDAALVHSVYMQIQVPFFHTFRRCHPEAHLLFFTNLSEEALPGFLRELFARLHVEVITLPYTSRPPKGWYGAWQNQFYLYDILRRMEGRMWPEDTLLIADADCLCRQPLDALFAAVRKGGSAFYEFITDRNAVINGITLPQMEAFYRACYQQSPAQPLAYYGGEFVCLRGDVLRDINLAYKELWAFNVEQAALNRPKLNEEAHVLSILAERLQLRNRVANAYVKRMWTSPQFNNIEADDVQKPVWHLPYEKKRGLFHLYRLLQKHPDIAEKDFWKKAQRLTGIPTISLAKRIRDRVTTLLIKLKN